MLGVAEVRKRRRKETQARCSLGSNFRREVKLRARTYRRRLGSFAMFGANSLAEEGNGPVGPLSPSHSRIWQRASRTAADTTYALRRARIYSKSFRNRYPARVLYSNAVAVNLNVVCIWVKISHPNVSPPLSFRLPGVNSRSRST